MKYKLYAVKLWHFIASVRTVRRNVVGAAIIISIAGSICLDAFIQNHQPVVIVNTAQAQVSEQVEEKPVIIEVKINWTKERIDRLIEEKAKEYGTSATTLKRIVACESGYVTDIQSYKILKYGREKSFGLVQIHLPDHPNITKEQAIDPAFAINYLAKHYAQGTDKWSCK